MLNSTKPNPMVKELRAENARLMKLLTDIRFALGDNGLRMQDDLIDYCKGIVAERDRPWIPVDSDADLPSVENRYEFTVENKDGTRKVTILNLRQLWAGMRIRAYREVAQPFRRPDDQ